MSIEIPPQTAGSEQALPEIPQQRGRRGALDDQPPDTFPHVARQDGAGTPPPDRIDTDNPRRRRRWAAGATVLAFVIGGGVLGIKTFSDNKNNALEKPQPGHSTPANPGEVKVDEGHSLDAFYQSYTLESGAVVEIPQDIQRALEPVSLPMDNQPAADAIMLQRTETLKQWLNEAATEEEYLIRLSIVYTSILNAANTPKTTTYIYDASTKRLLSGEDSVDDGAPNVADRKDPLSQDLSTVVGVYNNTAPSETLLPPGVRLSETKKVVGYHIGAGLSPYHYGTGETENGATPLAEYQLRAEFFFDLSRLEPAPDGGRYVTLKLEDMTVPKGGNLHTVNHEAPVAEKQKAGITIRGEGSTLKDQTLPNGVKIENGIIHGLYIPKIEAVSQ